MPLQNGHPVGEMKAARSLAIFFPALPGFENQKGLE
jgi:hypothetical protein